MRNSDFVFLVIRLFLGYVYFSSGLCKLSFGFFPQLIGPPDLITNLAQYQLAGLGYTIASVQVLTGALILTQTYSLLGLIMLLPISLSILSVTISLHWSGTPYVNAFLLILNLCALLYEWNAVKHLVLPHLIPAKSRAAGLFPLTGWALFGLGMAMIGVGVSFLSQHLMVVAAVIFLALVMVLLWRSHFLFWYRVAVGLMMVCGLLFTCSRYNIFMQKHAVYFFSGYFIVCLTVSLVALLKYRTGKASSLS